MFFNLATPMVDNLVFENNICASGSALSFATQGTVSGIASLDKSCTAYDFDTNLIRAGTAPTEGTYFKNFITAANDAAILFVDIATAASPGDYALQAGSPGHNAALDGTDIGCNMTTLAAALNDLGTVDPYVRIQQPAVMDLMVAQDVALDFTPTLLVGDATGTWSQANKPAWMTVNSATGQMTGTPTGSDLGRTRFKLTYTEGSTTDFVIVTQHVVSGTTVITAGAKSVCEILTTANRHYQLAGSVTYPTSAVAISADDIILDLNGYTITYDNAAQRNTLTNGDFSSGDTTGWDVTGAAAATVSVATGTIATGSAWLDGRYALKLVIPASTTIYIETSSVDMESGECNSFSFFQDQPWPGTQYNDFTYTISCSARNTDEASDNGNSWHDVNVSRPGEFATWKWTATTTESAPIRVTIENTAIAARTIYLSEFTITRSQVHGIVGVANDARTPWTGGSHSASNKCSIANGTITQGSNSSTSSTLWFGGTDGFTIDNLTVNHSPEVMGFIDAVVYISGWGCVISNSVIVTDCQKIMDRDQQTGYQIHGLNAQGSINTHVRNNTLSGSPQGAIRVVPTSQTPLYPATVKWNTVSLKGRYTNGFCISIAGKSGFVTEASHNTCYTYVAADDSGRGVAAGDNCHVHHNTVIVKIDDTNNEYHGYMLGGAYAFQSESTLDNLLMHDESYKIVGVGGGSPFRYNGASAFAFAPDNCTFDCTVDAGYDESLLMACIKFGSDGGNIPDPDHFNFVDCTLRTNWKLFNITSNDMTGTMTFTRPHIHIINDAEYTSGSPWYAIGTGTSIALIDPTYEDAFSQSEVETAEAADGQVTISTT